MIDPTRALSVSYNLAIAQILKKQHFETHSKQMVSLAMRRSHRKSTCLGRNEMRNGIALGLVLLIACAIAGPVKAATCGANSCTGQISTVYVNASGNIYVAMVGGLTGLTGCTPNEGAEAYGTLLPSSSNFNQVYALLLVGQTTSQQVLLSFVAGSNGCTINHVTVTT